MKQLKALKTVIESNSPRHYGSMVQAKNNQLTYTNGFYLVRIPDSDMQDGCYTKDMIDAHIKLSQEISPLPDTYPDCDRVIPKDLSGEITVNLELLERICKILKHDSKHKLGRLQFDIDDLDSPLKIVTENGSLGVLVPMKADY